MQFDLAQISRHHKAGHNSAGTRGAPLLPDLKKDPPMRLPALFAALALTAVSPVTALAQASTTDDSLGVSVNDARNWLISLGGSVNEPTTNGGVRSLQVEDSIPWTLDLHNCVEVCSNIGYGAAFVAHNMSVEDVNNWNRTKRFGRAFYVPAENNIPARIGLQFDVILTGSGVDQMREATVIWLKLRDDLASRILANNRN